MQRDILKCNTTVSLFLVNESKFPLLTCRARYAEQGPVSGTHDDVNLIVFEHLVNPLRPTTIAGEIQEVVVFIVRHLQLQGFDETGRVIGTCKNQ